MEFASYFHYCHSLAFDQRPDYGFLKRLFRDLFTREGMVFKFYIFTLHTCSPSWLVFHVSLILHVFWQMAGYEFDYIFDWTIIKYQQSQKNRPQSQLPVSIRFFFFLWITVSRLEYSSASDLNIHMFQPVPGGSNSRAMPMNVDNHQG